MEEDEALEPVLLTLEGKNGKIELKETTIRIVSYVRNDASRIDKVHDIPRAKITKSDYVKILGREHAIRVYFPGAGLMGNVAVYINEEQVSEAEKMVKMLTKPEASVVTNDEALKINLNTDTQANNKLPEKSSSYDIMTKDKDIKTKETSLIERIPLINGHNSNAVQLFGIGFYATLILYVIGVLVPSLWGYLFIIIYISIFCVMIGLFFIGFKLFGSIFVKLMK